MVDVPPNIDNTLGVLFITVILTVCLYGAGMLQGWLYFQKYKHKDPWPVRALVGFVLVGDTVQQALICHSVYMYCIKDHGDDLLTTLTKMHNTILIELFFGGAIAFAVQSFYCWRILKLSNSWYLFAPVWLLTIASLVTIWVYTAKVLRFTSLAAVSSEKALATCANAINAGTDVAITLSMIYLLQRTKKSAFRKTTDAVNRLIIFTFNTGIPTSVTAIVGVASLHILPNTFTYIGFYLIMDRFYTNSLLVSLNSRAYIQNGSFGGDTSFSEASFSNSQRVRNADFQMNPVYSSNNAKGGNDILSIHIQRETVQDARDAMYRKDLPLAV